MEINLDKVVVWMAVCIAVTCSIGETGSPWYMLAFVIPLIDAIIGKCEVKHILIGEEAKKLKEYEEIGTPENCRAAMEKQTARKVKSISQVKDGDHYVGLIGKCPCCGDILEEGTVYCDCGQKLDWSTDTVTDQEDTEARR